MLRSPALGVLFAALLSSSAHAREPGVRVVVRFTPQVSKTEAARLASAMRAQLGEAAPLTLEAAPNPDDVLVDVDRAGAGLQLHLQSGGGHALETTRRVAHGGELGASEAASIVRAFVLAATRPPPERTARPSPDDDAPVAPPTAAPDWLAVAPRPAGAAPSPDRARANVKPSPASWHTRLSALYTGATYAVELPWQSGARLEAAHAFLPGVYGGLSYALHPAAELATESAPVRISRHSGAIFVGLERGHRAFAIGADTSVGLDATTLTSTSSAVLTGGGARLAPVFALRLHGRWRVPGGRGAALDVAPTLELAPIRNRLGIDAAESSTQLAFAAARFRLDVGGTYDLF